MTSNTGISSHSVYCLMISDSCHWQKCQTDCILLSVSKNLTWHLHIKFRQYSFQLFFDKYIYKLIILGLPGKVMNFQGTNVSSSRLSFSWSPPHHIPGTECCSRYSINISNPDSEMNLTINDTTDPFVVFDIPSQYLCSVYKIQISAFNQLGEGEILDTRWSLGGNQIIKWFQVAFNSYFNIHCVSALLIFFLCIL